MPTSRLNNASRQYNYPAETVYDEAGQVIRPGVTTYGPRGVRPYYFFDELGGIVETGFLKKVNLYREKKTANVATQLALIDERLADLTYDGKEFLTRYVAATKNNEEQKQLLNSIPIILGSVASIIGTPATGAAVSAGLKVIVSSQYDDGSSTEKLKKKINSLEKEANYLIITKNKLTGEYARQAAAGQIDLTDESQVYENQTLSEVVSRQANTDLIPGLSNDTLLYLFIGLFLLIILRKRRKKKK